jgi:hypothetical protein
MTKSLITFGIVLAGLVCESCAGLPGIVIANPPDKGGKDSGRSYPSYRTLNIPNGHLPPPGSCRVWYPGKPPGQQPPPSSCSQALRDLKPGAWIITRLESDNKKLEVKEKKNNAVETKLYLID